MVFFFLMESSYHEAERRSHMRILWLKSEPTMSRLSSDGCRHNVLTGSFTSMCSASWPVFKSQLLIDRSDDPIRVARMFVRGRQREGQSERHLPLVTNLDACSTKAITDCWWPFNLCTGFPVLRSHTTFHSE